MLKKLISGFFLGAAVFVIAGSQKTAQAAGSLEIWWPSEGAVVEDTQPFKAMLSGRSVESYRMYWQVDNGSPVPMESNYADYPHKEASVDLSGWKWRGSGPYVVTFLAEDANGSRIAQKSTSFFVKSQSTQAPSPITELKVETTTVIQTAAAPAPVLESINSAPLGSFSPHVGAAAPAVEVWWPADNVTVSGRQPFKGILKGVPQEGYNMFWQVDGGGENRMEDNAKDYPHKESQVDLSGWNWQPSGSYAVTFVAKDKTGRVLAKTTVRINVPQAVQTPVQAPASAPAPAAEPVIEAPAPKIAPAPAPAVEQAPVNSGNVFEGAKLYVNPNSDAKRQADQWRSYRSADADQIMKIAQGAESFWMGGWNADVAKDANTVALLAEAQGALPVFVTYNVPLRDCGSYSAGGVASADAYKSWIRNLANGIGNRKAAVLIEPDGLANIDCMSSSDRATRIALIKDAVEVMKSRGYAVYIDAGNANWIGADEMANRLRAAGIDKADGFSLNISNFLTDEENIRYGSAVSSKVGGKHFVIDSSRNGSGAAPNYEWCNPPGRSLGRKPTTNSGHALVDAYLWVKGPGGSDGSCNGAPNAGEWYPEYALGLAQRTNW